MEGSEKYNLNNIDWKKIGVGAMIATIGTLLTYLTQVVGQVDFGLYAPVVVWALSIGTNIVRKWISDYSK